MSNKDATALVAYLPSRELHAAWCSALELYELVLEPLNREIAEARGLGAVPERLPTPPCAAQTPLMP